MVDVNEAFESENGFIVEGAAGFFSGSGTPTFTAPDGSMYIDNSTSYLWIKSKNNGWLRYKPGYIQYLMNGSVGNNQYILMDNLVDESYFSTNSPTEIVGFSWRNSSDNRNFDLQFQYGTTSPPGTTFYTYQARNKRFENVSGISPLIPGNNHLFIKCVSQGALPSDFSLILQVR